MTITVVFKCDTHLGNDCSASCDALFDLAEISSAPRTTQALCRPDVDGVDSQA